jgi:Fe-S-cluster containining protein
VLISLEVIRELLAASAEQRRALEDAYGKLPATRCRRRTDCCSLLPEISFVEALAAIRLLVNMAPARRHQLSKGLVRYFFLNPVEILLCPFLEGDNCLIYEDRFFGCRTYGLWSRKYYEKQAARSRRAKRLSEKQWLGLGVELPQEVVNFRLPYCPYVELQGNSPVDDDMILHAGNAIEVFSGMLSPWHDTFRQVYFSDLSFLMASLAFRMETAVQLKFEIVRDTIATGKSGVLEKIVNELPDFCEGLT